MKSLLERRLAEHLAGAPMRVPEADRLLWGWFIDLCSTRTYHAAGPHPIAYAEIEAYARLMRVPMEPRHVAALRALDGVWLKHARSTTPGTAPAQPLTAAAFDATVG